MDAISWGVVFVVLLAVGIVSHKKKLLDLKGIIAGTFVSLFVAERGGIGSFTAIILFFILGEFITQFVRNYFKRKSHVLRSTVNIVGNIGPALIALAFNPTPFNIGFFSSLSAAFADTLSGEIGVLSKDTPVFITTLKPAIRGDDGAVTTLGFAAAAFGGLLFGLLGYALTGEIVWMALLTLAGIFGTALDSVIGATLQRKGHIDNNTTNFLSALIIGAFFAFIF